MRNTLTATEKKISFNLFEILIHKHLPTFPYLFSNMEFIFDSIAFSVNKSSFIITSIVIDLKQVPAKMNYGIFSFWWEFRKFRKIK